MSAITRALFCKNRSAKRAKVGIDNVGREAKAAAAQLAKALADGRPTLATHALERIRAAGTEADGWLNEP